MVIYVGNQKGGTMITFVLGFLIGSVFGALFIQAIWLEETRQRQFRSKYERH